MNLHQMKLIVLAGLILIVPGCSRTFWREQADVDSYQAIGEKLTDERWAVPRVDMTADSRSRFFDPYDLDASPLPPDDPSASQYMQWVNGWKGYKGWHKFGDAMSVENPQWLAPFGMTPEMIDPVTGEYIAPVPSIENLTLPQAAELQQIHDRAYQTQIENVYLAALAVASERFAFGVRYLGRNGTEPGVASTTTVIPHGIGDRTSLTSNVGISQLLPAGTQWALELTNNTIWLFNGGTSTASILSYSITQPLLAGAGRKVVLESLTQTERDLLYQIRILARFRKQNFSALVTNGTGFLGLLQQVQSIKNEEGNILRLEEQVDRLLSEAGRNSRSGRADLAKLPEGFVIPPELADQLEYRPEPLNVLLWRKGTMSLEQEKMLRGLSDDPAYQLAIEPMIQGLRTEVAPLDVLQLQSDLQDSRNRLRILKTNLQSSYDSFKTFLGLPPDMSLSINDRVLKPFEVIDPDLTQLEQTSKDFILIWGKGDPTDQTQLRILLDRLSLLVDDVEIIGIGELDEDGEAVRQVLPRRLEELADPDAQEQLESDINRADFLLVAARQKLISLRNAVKGFQQSLENPNLSQETKLEVFEGIGYLQDDLVELVQSLTVIQISYRLELISLNPYELSMERSVEIGLNERLDLMNSRAAVMDARRQVEIAANLLKSNLDLRTEGNFRNAGDNPLDFRGELSDLRFGIGITTPLDQISEREVYRRTLISYQRAKRDYMQDEDAVKSDIRNNHRDLLGARSSLEIARRSVRIAALQFDSAVSESRKPSDPKSVGTNSGLQGRNLTQALSSVLRAQNQLIGFWTDYERNRINIHRDMGIMEIGPDGIWEDEYYRNLSYEAQPEEDPYETDSEKPFDPLNLKLPRRESGDVGAAGRIRLNGRSRDMGLEEPGTPEASRIQLISGDTEESNYTESFPWSVFD